MFSEGDVSYVYLQHNNVYIVALTRRNSNVTSVFVFLERLVEIMKEYFGTLEEESIRDNFTLVSIVCPFFAPGRITRDRQTASRW